MKKTLLILLISFVILPLSLYAQADDIAWADEDDIVEEFEAVEDIEEEEAPLKEKKPRGPVLGVKRKVEVGFVDINVDVGNDFLTFDDIFQDTLVIDLDNLSKGLNLNFGLALSPLYFSYNKDGIWGFGVSIKVEAIGALGISGKMLTFGEASNENSDVGGAAFAEVGLHGFFHVNKFKIKVKPALYYPIAYIDSDIKYTYRNSDNNGTAETRLKLGFDLDIYTAWPMGKDEELSLTATPGVDFYLGAEYPLSEVLGLKEKFFLLDFDVGLDIYNLPIVPSSMSDYMRVSGFVGSDDPIDFFDEDMDWDSFYSMGGDEDSDDVFVYGKKKKTILRPFKMVSWAHWRPFGDRFVSFFPSLGFAVNPLYKQPGSIEAGIKARLDLIKFFTVTAGTSYEDRMWRNAIDLALDLRAFEFDLGVSLCSPDFAKSWAGGGVGAHVGFKFGW